MFFLKSHDKLEEIFDILRTKHNWDDERINEEMEIFSSISERFKSAIKKISKSE